MKTKKVDKIKVAVFRAGKGLELKTIDYSAAAFQEVLHCKYLNKGCIYAEYEYEHENWPVIWTEAILSKERDVALLSERITSAIGYDISSGPYRVLNGDFIILQLKNIHFDEYLEMNKGELTDITDENYSMFKGRVDTIVTQSKNISRRMYNPALVCYPTPEEEETYFELPE